MRKRLCAWDYTFIVFVGLYIFCIIYKSSMPLMSGDDIAFFMSLQEGRQVWHGIDFDYKRFFPLAGWNLNVVNLFSSSPYAFSFGNSVVFLITSISYYMLALSFGASKKIAVLSFVLLSLSVGYVKIITQIPFPEMTQIMFLLLFLLCASKFYKLVDSVSKEKKTDIYIYMQRFRLSLPIALSISKKYHLS